MIITQMIFKIIDDIRLIYPLTYAFKALQNSFFFFFFKDINVPLMPCFIYYTICLVSSSLETVKRVSVKLKFLQTMSNSESGSF